MKEIGSRDLADLLNREQFEGIANFSGLVSIRLGGSKGLFYDAKGNFSLEKYGRALESTYALRYKESRLFFKTKKGSQHLQDTEYCCNNFFRKANSFDKACKDATKYRIQPRNFSRACP